MISTHTPHAGRNLCPRKKMCNTLLAISTHTPHAGRNDDGGTFIISKLEFQLTRPMRGATILALILNNDYE